MEKESDFGNIEYKRYIKFYNDKKKGTLSSQLKFRLREGDGICTYNIGVEDDGEICNISDDLYNESIDNLKIMCDTADAEILSIEKKHPNNDYDKYYYQIIITDKIPNNEIRILNITSKNDIELFGINNNNIFSSHDNTIYDIKKNSKTLIYINNVLSTNIIPKLILTYKPHIINFDYLPYNIDKLINLFKDMQIKYIFYNNILENINDIVNDEKYSKYVSKNLFNMFQILYNGNLLNQNKIYACIINSNILNKDNIYIHTDNSSKKLSINDIHYIYQSISSLKSDKLVSISSIEKINNEVHICNNSLCNCSIKYTNEISYNYNLKYENSDFIAYYKNNILKIKFKDNKIYLNKKVFIDENFLIIDLIEDYLLVDLFNT